jgi:hypothetical protein
VKLEPQLCTSDGNESRKDQLDDGGH